MKFEKIPVKRYTGPELGAARKALGLTQRRLAALIGRHEWTIRKWESETREVPVYMSLVLEALTVRKAGMIVSPGMRWEGEVEPEELTE